MTILEIKNLTVGIISRMSAADLYKTAMQIKKVVKRQARSIEVHNLENESFAYKRLMRNGGYELSRKDFTDKNGNLSINMLRGYVARMKQYVDTKTGTYKGYKSWINDTAERFNSTGEDWYRTASDKERAAFWKVYEDFTKDGGFSYWVATLDSDRVQAIVMEEYTDWDPNEETYVQFFERVKEKLNSAARQRFE